MPTLPAYKYRGARAMVILHDRYLREFADVWREAKQAGVRLPQVDDPDYQSLEHLLRHVLRSARGYMTWMCEVLTLSDPHIRSTPEAERIESELDSYLDHLLEQWQTPLANVPERRFEETFEARWGTVYCIDAMLEHAVMHPIRHTFQLRELLKKQTN
ncbi:hypothetical protein KKC97_13750 [bacterium]|nr:hypothetical protein [bacterium]